MNKTYILLLTIVLSVMGIAYLAAPAIWLATLGVQVSDPSVMNMIRGCGGFYLGFAAFLFLAVRKEGGAGLAVFAAVLAMAGLIVGRVVGLFAEGMPDRSILVAGIVEAAFALWGSVLLVRTRQGKA